jgi:hypothetical protein
MVLKLHAKTVGVFVMPVAQQQEPVRRSSSSNYRRLSLRGEGGVPQENTRSTRLHAGTLGKLAMQLCNGVGLTGSRPRMRGRIDRVPRAFAEWTSRM